MAQRVHPLREGLIRKGEKLAPFRWPITARARERESSSFNSRDSNTLGFEMRCALKIRTYVNNNVETRLESIDKKERKFVAPKED